MIENQKNKKIKLVEDGEFNEKRKKRNYII